MRSPIDGALVVGYVQYSLLWIYHFPKQYCIDIYRHRIFGESLFCFERSRDHADVNPVRHAVDNGNDKKQTWSFQFVKFTQAQYQRPLPLISDLDGIRNEQSEDERSYADADVSRVKSASIHD